MKLLVVTMQPSKVLLIDPSHSFDKNRLPSFPFLSAVPKLAECLTILDTLKAEQASSQEYDAVILSAPALDFGSISKIFDLLKPSGFCALAVNEVETTELVAAVTKVILKGKESTDLTTQMLIQGFSDVETNEYSNVLYVSGCCGSEFPNVFYRLWGKNLHGPSAPPRRFPFHKAQRVRLLLGQ